MANNDKIPSIKEVVAQLRAEGRLDEEKFKSFRVRMMLLSAFIIFAVVICISLAILTLSYSPLLPVLFVIIGCLILFSHSKVISDQEYQFALYNIGEEKDATIIGVKKYSRHGFGVYWYSINYKSKDDIKGVSEISKNQIEKNNFKAQKNEDIRILQYGKNPSINTIIIKSFSNFYTVTK